MQIVNGRLWYKEKIDKQPPKRIKGNFMRRSPFLDKFGHLFHFYGPVIQLLELLTPSGERRFKFQR